MAKTAPAPKMKSAPPTKAARASTDGLHHRHMTSMMSHMATHKKGKA